MSKYDIITLQGLSQQDVQNLAFSLGSSLYADQTYVLLYGELGAGKTVFAQSIAASLGITGPVTSPTYAIEQHYADMVHYDLYRISDTEASSLVERQQSAVRVIVVEWAEKLLPQVTEHLRAIRITLTPTAEHERSVNIAFLDVRIPSDTDIAALREEAKIPAHIMAHMDLVADVCGRIADHLHTQKRVVRKQALLAAAKLHDVLRFVDFTELPPDAPSAWLTFKQTYGTGHELAAEAFLQDRGFPDIGKIIARHGPLTSQMETTLTIEEKILMYADKRALHDRFVSVDERYEDFAKRYGENGKPTKLQIEWKTRIKRIEQELFPDGNSPF